MPPHPAQTLLLTVGVIQFWLIPLVCWFILKEERHPGPKLWFAGTACFAAAATLFALQTRIPSMGEVPWTGGLSILTVILFVEALRRELQRPAISLAKIVGTVIISIVGLYLVDRLAGSGWMIVAQLTFLSMLDLTCCFLLVQVIRVYDSRSLRFVLGFFAILIITNLLRVYGFVVDRESPMLLTFSSVSNVSFIANFISVVIYSLGYLGFQIEKGLSALKRETISRAKSEAENLIERAKGQSTLSLLREREQLIDRLTLMQQSAQMGALSATLAHEVSQPLTTIKLSADQALELTRAHQSASELTTLLSSISMETSRAATIISTLRDIFRGRQGVPESRTLDELVHSSCDLVVRRAQADGIKIIIDTCAPVKVMMGAGELEHVILNLLFNALNALRNDQISDGVIRVRTTVTGDRAILSVCDNALGIPQELRSSLFDLFTKANGEGSGLGLWLTRYIIERYNGTIEVNSAVDSRGTTFTVTVMTTESAAQEQLRDTIMPSRRET